VGYVLYTLIHYQKTAKKMPNQMPIKSPWITDSYVNRTQRPSRKWIRKYLAMRNLIPLIGRNSHNIRTWNGGKGITWAWAFKIGG
jgi:hypothetical protein